VCVCGMVKVHVCGMVKVPAGKKKGQKSAASKKKSTKSKSSAQRKANSKPGQPYAGNDLTAKLFTMMEKHKDVSHTLCLL